MVPNPCRAADGGDHVWIGVGHLNVEGGGARNAFGKAFQENGNVRKDIIFISTKLSLFEYLFFYDSSTDIENYKVCKNNKK